MTRPRVLVLDCFVDEPAALGVRPYIHPAIRELYGAALDAGAEAKYLTIDDLRGRSRVPEADISVVFAGCSVPGRYLRSMPASRREIQQLVDKVGGIKILSGPAALDQDSRYGDYDVVVRKDPAAAMYDLIIHHKVGERQATLDEWNRWLLKGSEVVRYHPDFPEPLVAEVSTYRGCVRYRTGGCSFCVEPLKGPPLFRDELDIFEEVRHLSELGVRHFRLGGQTCFVSYKSTVTRSEIIPNPGAVKRLLSLLSSIRMKTLHLDNANPAVISNHPEKSEKIIRYIVRYCSSGNVLALGMESADPAVIEANNLNATPEQVMESIAMINAIGREAGESGLPRLLPGLNFIVGLDGESLKTLDMNMEFLREIRRRGYLLRRINIRQVIPIRREFHPSISHGQFLKFKERVREEIDRPMLREMLPAGSVLKEVYLEKREGNRTFGRQIGTYPLLVGFNYPLETDRYVDAAVVGWGMRSVTAVEYPLPVNTCPGAALSSLPGIGKKRAARLIRGRPFRSVEEINKVLDDGDLVNTIKNYLIF